MIPHFILKTALYSLWLVIVTLIDSPIYAAQFEAKSATVEAPSQIAISAEAMALPPPDPTAERDKRESLLRDHHLPIPLADAAAPEALLEVIKPPETQVAQPGNPVTLLRNRALTDTETNNITSQVDEPSVAARRQEILMTGNWYAAFSVDGGATFSYVNPDTTFPAVNGGFCCDQVVLYHPGHDLMIWYLQYIQDGNQNTGRIAVAHGNDITTQQWRFYDFAPQNIGNWNNEWLDFPAMAASNDFLYLTSNMFSTPPFSFTRAVVLRLPLAQLAAYQGFTYNYFDVTTNGSLRPTRGATDVMYFGTHQNTGNLIRVFSWPETGTTITTNDVGVQFWSNTTREAPGPSDKDWLGRMDRRMTGAWRSGNEIGFVWTASKDANFPFPHVRVAIMDTATMTVVREPHIWNSNYAFAYPSTATNSQGVVGISVAYGGGSQFEPSHAVGFLEAPATWDLVATANGTHGPARNVHGDYLDVSPHGSQQDTWVATGFTQQGGSQAADVEPRYVHFQKQGTTLPLQISLTLDPDKRLDKGDTTTLRAKVTRGGNPVQGETVTFTSTNTGLASVSPSSAVTDSNGVAQTTVTGNSNSKDTVPVKATAGGLTATIPVRVPDLSMIAFAILLTATILIGILARKRKQANSI